MAKSKCPNQECPDKTAGFESKDCTIDGYPHPVSLIQCKRCGTVVGSLIHPLIVADIQKIPNLLKSKS